METFLVSCPFFYVKPGSFQYGDQRTRLGLSIIRLGDPTLAYSIKRSCPKGIQDLLQGMIFLLRAILPVNCAHIGLSKWIPGIHYHIRTMKCINH